MMVMIVRRNRRGIPVVVKRAECHAAVVDLYVIRLHRLPAAYAVFDVLK